MNVAPGAPLHVESSGQGAPIVFWHGWGMNLRVFDALRAALAPDFRTQAVDLPGHGQSAWHNGSAARPGGSPGDGAGAGEPGPPPLALDALLAPLLRVLPEHATLIGWSLGGQLALRAATLAPGRVARLVLIATTPCFRRTADWPYGVEGELLAQMRERLGRDLQGTLEDFLQLQLRGSRTAPLLLESLRAGLRTHGEPKPQALAAGLAALAQTDLRPLLAQVRQPVLVIGGQYDRVTAPAAAKALAAALPDGRYHEFARSAHAPFLSHAAEFLALLREFIGPRGAS
jgi:pimeloyl-[acyl-carrier protein] methyl ester esterase